MKSYSHSTYHCDYSRHITPLELNQIRKVFVQMLPVQVKINFCKIQRA